MKLDEISLEFFRKKKEAAKPIPKGDPEQAKRLADRYILIKNSERYDEADEAADALDRAIAPYAENDDGEEVAPKNYDRAAHDLSDVGVRHVIDRVQNTHYGAGRLKSLEKELDDISNRINIH